MLKAWILEWCSKLAERVMVCSVVDMFNLQHSCCTS